MNEFQVVMPGDMKQPLINWLAARGLGLFPIPVEDDLPTYGIASAIIIPHDQPRAAGGSGG